MSLVMEHTPSLLITEPHDTEHSSEHPILVSPSATYAPSFSRPAILSPSFFSPEPSVYDGDTDSLRGCDSESYFFRRLTSFGCGGSNFSSRAETPLNLGAESPGSLLKPAMTPIGRLTPATEAWEGSGIATVQGDLPPRPYHWRSSSFQRRMADTAQRRANDKVSCGICHEPPADPRKMKCCGALFCLDHITNRLASDGCCPSCNVSPFEPTLSSLSCSNIRHLPSIDTAPDYDSDDSDSDSDMDGSDTAFTTTTTPILSSDDTKANAFYSSSPSSLNPDNFVMERFISTAILVVVVAGLIKWS
jgi:hypothetical protein